MSTPVLLLTQDENHWQHWRQIGTEKWVPARGNTLQDLARWRDQGRSLAILDNQLPRLPAWSDHNWPARLTNMQVIVTSIRPLDHEAAVVLSAGASGYLHAYTPAPVLDSALSTVAAGGVWLGRSLVSRILQEINQRAPVQNASWKAGLTEREIEVAELAAIGQGNQAIADALGITERTVRAHLSAVFEKLNVSDRLMLALRVHGIAEPHANAVPKNATEAYPELPNAHPAESRR